MAKKTIFYQENHFEIAYDYIDNKASENIVFLHGWGSNKEIMQIAFKAHFRNFNHFYIDLPGFGRSFNDKPLFTKDYAKILEFFFSSLELYPSVIVGHSFGGKVAVLLEKDVILLSTAGILEPKPLKIKLKILFAKFLKKLPIKFGTNFLRSQDANNLNEGMYQTFKNVVDEDFSEIFAKFSKKATIFWGINDKATSLDSGKKISKLIKNSRFFELKGDHYFFLEQGGEIDRLFCKGFFMKQTMHILVYGVVQGVGYRKFVKNKAEDLGIKGSVENLEDFSVEIYANGEFEILESFISLLRIGPQNAIVEDIKTSVVSRRDFKDFSILRK